MIVQPVVPAGRCKSGEFATRNLSFNVKKGNIFTFPLLDRELQLCTIWISVSLFFWTKTRSNATLTKNNPHLIQIRHKQNKPYPNSLGLSCHNYLWFCQNKSSINRVRYKNILSLHAVFACNWCPAFSWPSAPSCLSCPWSLSPVHICCKSPLYCIPLLYYWDCVQYWMVSNCGHWEAGWLSTAARNYRADRLPQLIVLHSG